MNTDHGIFAHLWSSVPSVFQMNSLPISCHVNAAVLEFTIPNSTFNIPPAAVGGWRLAVGGWRLAVGGWPLFFCGGHALEFDLGIILAGEVEPKGFFVHVCEYVNTLFPGLFAVVGFARLDLGVVLAVAAALILV